MRTILVPSGVPTRVQPRVPYVDFPAQFGELKTELLQAIEGVLAAGDFILGAAVRTFEQQFAELCGTKHAVGVANGTDALILTLKALGVAGGDEVITVPNSWISSASAIVLAGAQPVFVDVRDDLNIDPEKIEAAITPRTKAIIPVHLTGRIADMDPVLDVARRRGIAVIEDAAQAAGARYKERPAGSFGVAACFSLHPLKNLNAAGDAGIITTDDDELAVTLRLLRNHGLKTRDEVVIWGYNSRLDSLQAALLSAKLKSLRDVNERRRANARQYRDRLRHLVLCPPDDEHQYDIYHLFVIQAPRRDELRDYLASRGVETKVHYPIPIHLQECCRGLGYRRGDFPVTERQADQILSLPVHQYLDQSQRDLVADLIERFYA